MDPDPRRMLPLAAAVMFMAAPVQGAAQAAPQARKGAAPSGALQAESLRKLDDAAAAH